MGEDDFGCSHLSADGQHCTLGETEQTPSVELSPAGEKVCNPEECPLIEDLMIEGDLFNG